MKRKKYKKRKFFDKFSYSNRNTNIFLICSFLFVLFGLTIGYSVLSNVLSIKGDVAIRPFKDIRITSVTGPEISNGAYETYNFKYSHDLLVVNGVLPNTSSSLTYTITVTNNGTVDMDLIDIINSCTDSNVYYELNGINLGDTIEAGTSVTFNLILKTNVGSNNSFTSQLQFIFEESYVDITPPEIVFNPIASSDWKTSDYNVEIKATDDIEVTSFMYCVTTNNSCTPNIVVTNNSNVNVTINTSGNNTICALASDSSKYGPNSVTVCSNKDGNYYKLDKEKPSINVTLNGTKGNNNWYRSNVILNVEGIDNISGYKGHRYQTSTDNGVNYSTLSDYVASNITLSQECVENKVKIIGYDNALNSSEEYTSETIKIDKTAPIITVDGHTSSYSVNYIKPSSNTICTPVSGTTSYDLGTEYTCDVGDGTERTFYVLEDNGDSVDLIMSENLGSTVAWNSSGSNTGGPVTANNYLESQTTSWTVDVSLPTGQQIANAVGNTSWTSGGNSISLSNAPWLYDNLWTSSNTSLPDGYWTSTPYSSDSRRAWSVYSNGSLLRRNVDTTDYGVRPVITISKDEISEGSSTNEYTIPTGTATDNCGGSVSITTEGTVNTNLEGSYPITYKATDEAGNTTTLTLTVNVEQIYANQLEYSNTTYTECSNAQCALDELYELLK